MPWDGHWADISLIEKGTQKGKYKNLEIAKCENKRNSKVENTEKEK